MSKKIYHILSLLLLTLLTASCCTVFADQEPKTFPFSETSALEEWEEKIFKGKVLYVVKVEKRDGYLSAYSQNSASGIFYRLKFDPKETPMISWKWKVLKFPEKKSKNIIDEKYDSKQSWLEKDDYAARLYVIFPKISFNLTKSLEYVWDASLPKGTILTSPYSENIKIIVAESGKKYFKKWIYEERNIVDDYEKAFGRAPGEVGAIAIMTDTDNTTSTAEASYDEIKVGYKK